jgi:hypothetical protein
VSETALTGGPVRFDYTALDAERGRLFIAHMGAGEVIESSDQNLWMVLGEAA